MRTFPPLPRGRHFALTWGIVSPFGGMTTALLDRSRMFAAAGTPVDVLTLDPRAGDTGLDLTELAAAGVRVRNLYDWVREATFTPRGTIPAVDPLDPPRGDGSDDDTIDDVVDGVLLRRLRVGADGRPREIDHLRPDGTIAMSERRTGPKGRGRLLVAWDAAGRPARVWKRRHDLYAAWLDHLTADERSYLIVDSKTVAPFALDYRRANITTVHVVHGSHRGATAGSVRASRRDVFARLAAFDAVAFATDGQRDDVRAIVGRVPHLVTVAHPVRPVPTAPDRDASPRSGAVVVARLEPIKRVDHAIEAVRRHNADTDHPVALDVYGSGSLGDELAELAASDPAIRLHGHIDDPAPALAGASVLLLTSRSEAFGLVLLEAMAAGCLPIAYDIPYGPADLIRHGENGWLVSAGDVDALADAVAAASALSPSELDRMRRNARAAATRFGADRITRRWAVVLRTARARRRVMGLLRPVVRATRRGTRVAKRTVRRMRAR